MKHELCGFAWMAQCAVFISFPRYNITRDIYALLIKSIVWEIEWTPHLADKSIILESIKKPTSKRARQKWCNTRAYTRCCLLNIICQSIWRCKNQIEKKKCRNIYTHWRIERYWFYLFLLNIYSQKHFGIFAIKHCISLSIYKKYRSFLLFRGI